MTDAVDRLREVEAQPDIVLPVSPGAYAAIVRATVRDPFERVKLLFNAGFRGADLR